MAQNGFSFNMNEKINFYGYDIKFAKMALDNFQDFSFWGEGGGE